MVLRWPLPYTSMSQPQVYLCPVPPESASCPTPTPPLLEHPPHLSHSTGLITECRKGHPTGCLFCIR